MSSPPAQNLKDCYLELRGDGSVETIPLTPAFWPELMSGKRKLKGRLVMASRITEDMRHWERHPAGDEVLLLLSGAVTVVLEGVEAEERFELSAGQAFIVPRGRWHRIEAREAGDLVFMTAGEGTEHKPLDEAT